MAEKINAKLGYRPVQPVEEEDKELDAAPAETFKRYEEELEINDFPQTARWKVTSKARPSLFPFLFRFICFLLLSIPSRFTRIVPLHFQAGGRRKRPNLGLVFYGHPME